MWARTSLVGLGATVTPFGFSTVLCAGIGRLPLELPLFRVS